MGGGRDTDGCGARVEMRHSRVVYACAHTFDDVNDITGQGRTVLRTKIVTIVLRVAAAETKACVGREWVGGRARMYHTTRRRHTTAGHRRQSAPRTTGCTSGARQSP